MKNFSQLKKTADQLCSEYVRRSYADWKGNVQCFTCPKTAHYRQMQCGHYVSRVYTNLRWHLPNLRVQCPGCNIFKKGNMDEYAIRLERETPGILNELNEWKHRPSSPNTRKDLEMVIRDFKDKIKLLK